LIWLFLLSSICTAYAFSASVKVMKFLSPFTVMLTINLEPIYGIILALLIFDDTEEMSPLFYIGALIILTTVIANGISVGLHVSQITPHAPWGKRHPPHAAAKTTSASPTVFAEGDPVLRVGSGNSCGHSIVQGSPNVFVP
jgi:uncharacterized Zn-binding protein involved in type VI secretion